MNIPLQSQWDEFSLKLTQFWQNKFAPHYDALDEREQKILKIAAIILPIIIFIFGILLPILDTNKTLKTEINSLATKVNEANQLADILAANPSPQTHAPANNNILGQVDKLAREAGVRSFMTRLRPQQIIGSRQRLQTQIKDVPYQKLTDFISLLEKNGYNINQLRIQVADVGVVHAQASIGR